MLTPTALRLPITRIFLIPRFPVSADPCLLSQRRGRQINSFSLASHVMNNQLPVSLRACRLTSFSRLLTSKTRYVSSMAPSHSRRTPNDIVIDCEQPSMVSLHGNALNQITY